MQIFPIAYIHNDFKEKFGIPRQSGRSGILSEIVFEEKYRVPEALRGIEGFSHLWLIFDFSRSHREAFSPTVRPPRLGGNKRVGVFASRSPFRPNSLGLSCVKLEKVKKTEKNGTVLVVSGADLLDMTPIYDIKPYLTFSDSYPDAECGYAQEFAEYSLKVSDAENYLSVFDKEKRKAVIECLQNDPRPSYKSDENEVFTMTYANYDISFQVKNDTLFVIGASCVKDSGDCD